MTGRASMAAPAQSDAIRVFIKHTPENSLTSRENISRDTTARNCTFLIAAPRYARRWTSRAGRDHIGSICRHAVAIEGSICVARR
jgi:hypothetical protein